MCNLHILPFYYFLYVYIQRAHTLARYCRWIELGAHGVRIQSCGNAPRRYPKCCDVGICFGWSFGSLGGVSMGYGEIIPGKCGENSSSTGEFLFEYLFMVEV